VVRGLIGRGFCSVNVLKSFIAVIVVTDNKRKVFMEVYIILIGFLLASYSIIANDSIQTLGTFLSSNSHRPWWILWIYISSIFTAVIVYGWIANGGDVSYGRLEKFPPPENFSWLLILPPLLILFLTRFGVPVSTTFLVLTVFAPTNLEKMLTKSLLGYFLAFAVAIALYLVIAKVMDSFTRREPSRYWVVLQWLSTGFLWSQWLIQDLANIFVYMPSRELTVEYLIGTIILIWGLQGYIFKNRGGAIQNIVESKSGTADIRSATIIDLTFAILLLFFKEWSNLPMSTTWVFLGLLAGREIAIGIRLKGRDFRAIGKDIGGDALKAFLGLSISVAIALLIGVV
jgi:hypothetical protein